MGSFRYCGKGLLLSALFVKRKVGGNIRFKNKRDKRKAIKIEGDCYGVHARVEHGVCKTVYSI